MLIKNGKKIVDASWSPYSGKNKHILYSITKTFSSIAIGFTIDDNLLSVDDNVITFFPERVNENNGPFFNELQVKHLLTMTIGQHAEGPYADPIALAIEKNEDWTKIFFNVPILHKPGTVFLYNTLASHILSTIVEKVTKKSTAAYLQQKLFAPLGIKDFDWEISPTGVNTGGWGLRLNTEDMAKVGLLFLQNGKWNNKQIISEKWVKNATSFKVDLKNVPEHDTARANSWNQGYGYQWWLYQKGIYAAQGSEGQSIMILPKHNAVMAITGNVNQRQSVTHLIKNIIIPDLNNKKLQPDKKAVALLNQKISRLKYLPARCIKYSAKNSFYNLQANNNGIKSVSFDFDENYCNMGMTTDIDKYEILFENEQWIKSLTRKKGPYRMHSPTSFKGLLPFKIAGSYFWQDENTLILTIIYLESAHFETITCNFDKNSMKMEIKSSMNVINKFNSAD